MLMIEDFDHGWNIPTLHVAMKIGLYHHHFCDAWRVVSEDSSSRWSFLLIICTFAFSRGIRVISG